MTVAVALASAFDRLRRHRLAPLFLVLALALLLHGSFLGEPVLLDSLSIRVKTKLLSLPQLFDSDSTSVVNPYYRPLYWVLQRGADLLPGSTDSGERLLAVASHVLAALALWRLARAMRLRRSLALVALALFLLAPPNFTTVAWSIVGYWTLAAAFTWFAAADFVEFAATGRRKHAIRALLLFVASLFSAETGYHFVALLPLLALVPPRAGGRRARPLLLWPLVAAIALVHFRVFEAGARGLVTTAPLDRIRSALAAWPRYFEGALGGDTQGGLRPIAWVALALLVLGVGRSSRRRFLALAALLSPLPFAVLGHNDRYGYFAYGMVALAFAACAPRGLALLLHALQRKPKGLPRWRWMHLPGAAGLLLFAWVAVDLVELPARVRALQLACRETAQLRADLAPIAPKLDPLDRVAFVNCPSTLRWAVYDALPLRRGQELPPLVMANVLCTRGGYFAPAALDFAPLGTKLVIECDGGRLLERVPDRPLGPRDPLPFVFLAGGLEVAAPPAFGLHRELDRQRWFDALLARARALEQPLDHVLVEAPIEGLADPLPRERLEWKLAPIETPAGAAAPPGLFGQQLLVHVEVEWPAFLVAVTWLAAEDPLRRVTGDFDRHSALLEATLDGRPAPIVPAFVHGCGIVVPAGAHDVALRARPLGGKAFAPASDR